MDERSAPLIPLLQSLSYTNSVTTSPGIMGYPMGGQPIDFGQDGAWRAQYTNVYHLGFRTYPFKNLTYESWVHSGVPIDPANLLIEPCLERPLEPFDGTLVIHMEASSDPSRFDRTMLSVQPILPRLVELFESIKIIQINEPNERYSQLLGHSKVELISPDFVDTAQLLRRSMLIGTYSSNWVLMALLRGPQVVMMEPGVWNPHRLTTTAERLIHPMDPNRLLEEICLLLDEYQVNQNSKET